MRLYTNRIVAALKGYHRHSAVAVADCFQETSEDPFVQSFVPHVHCSACLVTFLTLSSMFYLLTYLLTYLIRLSGRTFMSSTCLDETAGIIIVIINIIIIIIIV